MNCFLRSIAMAIILSILILPDNLASQGTHLQKGTTGVGISGSYFANNWGTGAGYGFGISIYGMLDARIDVISGSREELRENEIPKHYWIPTLFSQSLSLRIINQSDKIPISVIVGISNDEISNQYYESGRLLEKRKSGSFRSIIGSINRRMEINPDADCILLLAYKPPIPIIGLSIDYRTLRHGTFFIQPSAGLAEGGPSIFSISTGFIFLAPNSDKTN